MKRDVTLIRFEQVEELRWTRCYEYIGLLRDFEFKANEQYLRHSIKHIKIQQDLNNSSNMDVIVYLR
jgi:hypothetical protein